MMKIIPKLWYIIIFFYFYCYSLQFCLLFIPLVKEKPVLKEHRIIDPFLVLPTPQRLVDLVVLGGGQLGALPHLRQVGHQSWDLILLGPGVRLGHHGGTWWQGGGFGWARSGGPLGLSQRHVCRVLGLNTAVVRFVSMVTLLLILHPFFTGSFFIIHILHHKVT